MRQFKSGSNFFVKLIKKGATRWVILTNKYAVKFPRPDNWRAFLNGLLGNMQERSFSELPWPKLCPVAYADPIGLILVMPRCLPVTDEQWEQLTNRWDEFKKSGDFVIPVEKKRDSVGMLNGQFVVIDYGS